MKKRLIYQVYVGGKKLKLYDYCIESVKKYCEKYDLDHIVQMHPRLMISLMFFLQTEAKNHMKNTAVIFRSTKKKMHLSISKSTIKLLLLMQIST